MKYSHRKLRLLMVWALILTALPLLGDGFIIIEPPRPIPPRPRPVVSFDPFPLAVKQHLVTVNISNQAAVTHIDQIFLNPTPNRLEGYYIFPIPAGATISKFSMFIDGKETEAELLDADKARKIYQDIVRRMIDPALLEYSGQGMLKVRIFPIEPGSEKRVKISYSEVLPKESGTVEYRYPLNTEKFSSRPLESLRIQVNIRSQQNIQNIYCPTHEVDIHRSGSGEAVVGYEANRVKPDRDFKLYFRQGEDPLGLSLMTYQSGKDEGFFMLSISPAFNPRPEVIDKDIAFVLDVSGSMAGQKLDQAKKALRFCIENLNRGDRFQIIRFSTQAEALFRELADADEGHRREAATFIDALRAIGGTNIEAALQLALENRPEPGRPYFVVFITDGKPTIGEIEEGALLEKIRGLNLHQTRIFTFGIGEEINTHLLDKLTEATHAFRSYISPTEDIEIKVSDFYTKVASPVLTGLQLDVSGAVRVNRLYPVQLPDLFQGGSLTVLGRYRNSGRAAIRLSGTVNQSPRNFEAKAVFAQDETRHDFIPALWASRAVGYMLDQIRLKGENEELKQEIIELARTYGIITPYTSYLIVEDEEQRVVRRQLAPRFQLLRPNFDSDTQLRQDATDDYLSLQKKSGGGSVRSSQDVQGMRDADNLARTRPGADRLAYRARDGRQQNVLQQMRMMNGRAFYQNGSNWVDAEVSANAAAPVKRIRFGSDEYFALLDKPAEFVRYLSLGRNVLVYWEGEIYEVYEE